LFRERGFTFVELAVVAGLVLTALGCWLTVALNARGADRSTERLQDYERLVASLTDRVKRDVRSCSTLEEQPQGTWTLRVTRLDGSGQPVESTVVYRRDEGGKRIERRSEEEVETYDFTPVLDGQEFVFEIHR
jgi:type II secretory pathway pseudopilin PulG